MTFQSQMQTITSKIASMPANIAAEVGKIIIEDVMIINGNAFPEWQFDNWKSQGCLQSRIAKAGWKPTHRITWEITAHLSTTGRPSPEWVLARKHISTERLPEA